MNLDELKPDTLTTPPESYGAGETELETIAKRLTSSALRSSWRDFLNRHLEQQLVDIEQDLKQLGPHAGSGENKA